MYRPNRPSPRNLEQRIAQIADEVIAAHGPDNSVARVLTAALGLADRKALTAAWRYYQSRAATLNVE